MAKKTEGAISRDRAKLVLENVFSACSVPPNTVPMEILEDNIRHNRFITLLTRGLAVLALLAVIILPFVYTRASVSCSVGAPQKDSLVIVVESAALLPVKEVRFTLDGEPLDYTGGNGSYQVPVSKNGTFLAEVTTLNNATAQAEVEVRSFVYEKPKIVTHSYQDGVFTFTVERGDFDVDFAGIYALDESGERKEPESYNESTGEVVFGQVSGSYNFFVPDVNGDVLQAILTPEVS